MDGNEEVANEELLYRRIPKTYYGVEGVSTDAFRPRDNDTTGLSFSRDKYKSAKEAAKSVERPENKYYVAKYRAGDLRKAGMTISPRPLPDDPGHCELTDIRVATKKDSRTLDLKGRLAEELLLEVLGPF